MNQAWDLDYFSHFTLMAFVTTYGMFLHFIYQVGPCDCQPLSAADLYGEQNPAFIPFLPFAVCALIKLYT